VRDDQRVPAEKDRSEDQTGAAGDRRGRASIAGEEHGQTQPQKCDGVEERNGECGGEESVIKHGNDQLAMSNEQ
jgi:hypothetical protein